MEERDKEKQKIKAQREKEKQMQYEKRRLDKQKMHTDKMAIQESILQLFTSLIDKEKDTKK